MLWNDQLMQGLTRGLDAAALRQKVTANNIANLNTPGFKRSYVLFNAELDKARSKLPLARTNPCHYPGRPGEADPRVQTERHTSRRTDGNNVDLDQEMLDLVTNQLHYNALIQRTSGRLAAWRYVITEGRG
ncbi:MAG: flagellar basal body rod protein FlgB [Bacillota bacterium]